MVGAKVIEPYLEDKFLGNQGDSRFKYERGEYHASSLGKCLREQKWKFTKGTPDEASPYFELGPIFEDMYGEGLELVYDSDRVVQDVNCEISFGDFHITGESDWVVLREDPSFVPGKVFLDAETGEREVRPRGSDARPTQPYEGVIDHVIETKTIKDIDYVEKYEPRRKYLYQVQTYMYAFDCPGLLAYMERDDISEDNIVLERDEHIELDLYLRAKRQHDNLGDDTLPVTDPDSERKCERWCHFKEECQAAGGSRWE